MSSFTRPCASSRARSTVFAALCAVLAITNASGQPLFSVAPSPSAAAPSDADILAFALNLEYLEAEFYSCAAFGKPIDASLRGGGPASTGCQKANLSSVGQQFAEEIARNEIAHVTLLREALGSAAVPIPEIDIGTAFADVLNAAVGGVATPTYSPYANDIFFYLGVFMFEDVGVTAYEGAIGQIRNTTYLETAAKIAAVEAYQSGIVRTLLFTSAAGGAQPTGWPYKPSVADVVQDISNLRNTADGPGNDDFGIVSGNQLTLVPVDSNSLVFTRTPTQVVDIVTLGKGPSGGGFLPSGLNGNLRG